MKFYYYLIEFVGNRFIQFYLFMLHPNTFMVFDFLNFLLAKKPQFFSDDYTLPHPIPFSFISCCFAVYEIYPFQSGPLTYVYIDPEHYLFSCTIMQRIDIL